MQLRIILILISTVFSFNSVSAQILNFEPGEYELTKGNDSSCGGGDFKYLNDDESLALNGLHLFSVKKGTSSFPDSSKPKSQCLYKIEDKVETIDSSTSLVYKEVYSCKGKDIYSLSKKARITKDGASLDTVQTGKPSFQYNCEWTKKKREMDSVKKIKSAPKQK